MAEAEDQAAAAVTDGYIDGPFWTADRKRRVLADYRRLGTLDPVADLHGVVRGSLHAAMARDPAWKADMGVVTAEQAAKRRAATCARAPRPLRAVRAATGAGPRADDGGTPSDAPPLRDLKATRKDKAAFLAMLAAVGGVSTAAARMGVTLTSVFSVRDGDAAFFAGWLRASATFIETAESEMVRGAAAMFNPALDQGHASAADLRAAAAVLEKAKAELTAAQAASFAGAAGPAAEQNLEAARMELEARLCGLVERFGDPFGDDPARPLRLAVPVGAP